MFVAEHMAGVHIILGVLDGRPALSKPLGDI
jgi:hypothetical protein